MYEPFIAQAAKQKADLVVLGETVTYVGLGKKPHEVAEPVPGPSTEYFGSLAKKHNLYIVAGLYERYKHLVYNVAVLMGPDGKLVGKYRKVCLPRDEIACRRRARQGLSGVSDSIWQGWIDGLLRRLLSGSGA